MKIDLDRIVGRKKGAVKKSGYQNSEFIASALLSINESLEPIESRYVEENQGDSKVIVISYLPRSGSTYLYQLLCKSGNFNYISNFQSRFWRTPCLGRLLEGSIGPRNYDSIEMTSNLGITQGWESPSEFNYFWEEQFGIEGGCASIISKEQFPPEAQLSFRKTIGALLSFEAKPLLFKKEWLGMNAVMLSDCLPNVEFVHINRSMDAVVNSMLRARIQVFGEEGESLFGAAAPDYKFDCMQSLEANIRRQMEGLESYIKKELTASGCPVHEVSYEMLVEDPVSVLQNLNSQLFGHD